MRMFWQKDPKTFHNFSHHFFRLLPTESYAHAPKIVKQLSPAQLQPDEISTGDRQNY